MGSGEKNSIALMHCTTSYPCPFENVNLKAMETLKNEFGLTVGYSDHTLGVEVPIAAVAMGAKIIEKHFIDSLTILKYIKDDYTMIDVGTGAGFPGLPIAISSKAEVTLLDSLNKRVNFLNSISTELGLNNVNTIHGRAEEMGANQKYREKYDIAVSRAVAPMNVLVEYLLPFVKIGGICICMKGPKADEELKEAKRAIKLLGGEIIKQEKLKLDNESEKDSVTKEIIDVTSVLQKVRKEIKLCDEIYDKVPKMKEQLKELDEKEKENAKESFDNSKKVSKKAWNACKATSLKLKTIR